MATGVLVIGIERATKILGLLTGASKSYAATIRLGQTTSTEDAEGELLQSVSAAHLTTEASPRRSARLRGDIRQVPSAVSAIKVDGRRAYQLVREGHAVELQARPVRIDRFELLRRAMHTSSSSTSTSKSTARREPTSARWPAISALRWGSAGI